MWLIYVIHSFPFRTPCYPEDLPTKGLSLISHKAAGLPLLLDTNIIICKHSQSKLSLQTINYSVANHSICRTQSMSRAFPLRQARRKSEISSASGKLCCSGNCAKLQY